MLQDSTALLNKTDEETTGEDIKNIIGSPIDVEEPLVEEDTFETQQSQTPLHKSIPLKFILAGVATLVLLVPVLLLLSGNLIGKGDPNAADDESVVVETEESEEEKALRKSKGDNADLRRQLALQNQSFTAADLEEEAQEKQDAISSTGATTDSSESSPATVVASPTNVSASRSVPVPVPAPPRPPVAARPPTPPPVRTIASRPPVAAPVPITQSRPPAVSRVRSSIDYAQLANDGSYGSLPKTEAGLLGEATATNSVPQTIQVAARSSTGPILAGRSVKAVQPEQERTSKRPLPTVMNDSPTAARDASFSVANQPLEIASSAYDEERDLIMGESATAATESVRPVAIFAGSAAQGQIEQPVSWTPDMPALQGSIILTSPLFGGDYEVLPVGTEIVVEISAISESGAVSLQPTSIMLPNQSPLNLSIPIEAMQILASDGGYPLAQIENSSDAVLRRIDRQQAFLGALSGAGGFINRPDSESGVVGIGGSSFNRNYGSGGSVIAAVLQGAADEMLGGRSDRLAAQAEVLASRPTIWTLQSGTNVQIFINQEIQL